MALGTILAVTLGASVASTIGGTVASVVSNKKNQQRQYEQQNALMEKQAELNQEQWQKQFDATNEYNSPANQLALKQAAGLNPLFTEGNYGSSASPAGSVSLPSPSVAEGVDYGSLLQSVFTNLFQMKNLQVQQQNADSETKKADAEVKKTDAYVVNTTNQTNSQMRVDSAKVKALLEESNLSKEQQEFVVQQTEASKAMVSQKWKELEIASESLGLKAREISNQEYTSRWQEQVGYINARSNALSAQASKSQADTASKVYDFGVKKWYNEYKLQVAKYSKQCTNENIENFMKMYEAGGASLFGVKFAGKKDVVNASAFCESFVHNMNKLDAKAFNQALPSFLDAMDTLESYELSPMQPKQKKSYNPAPWFPDEM